MQLKSEIIREYQEWKTVLWVSLALNLLAYLGFIIYETYSFDDYTFILHEVDHIKHGRWFAGFVQNVLLGNSFILVLAPIINMAFYIFTGIFFCKLWGLTKKTSLPVIALWSLHPYLLDAYNFRMATIACAGTYLIVMFSLLLVQKGKAGFILSVIIFYIALSTYQTALGFAVAVIMVQVLLISFRESFSSESIRNSTIILFRYILMLAVSVIVYFVFTKLLFACFDIEVNHRFQAGFISNMTQLKAKLCVVATTLFVRLGPIKEYVLPFVGKLVMFVIYIGALVTIIKKTPKLSTLLMVLMWVSLIPLGAISFLLPLESLVMPWRIHMGLVVFFVGMFALTQESDFLMIRRCGMALASFLIVYFILNNNVVISQQHWTTQKDVLMGTRIIAKIQSLDGYQPDSSLAIIGNTKKETFTRKGKSNLEIATEYMRYNTTRRYSLSVSAFETDWSKYFFMLDYMGLELEKCTPAVLKEAASLSKDKKPWPNPSSVFIHDETVVVILSSDID